MMPSAPIIEADDFQKMVDFIPQLAWIADADGWIYWFNQRWYDYTGTTLEEMQGWGWQKVHHPDHVDAVVAKVNAAFASGEPWEDTFPLKSSDGTYRWFLSRALPIRDEEGRVTRWFGTNTDITEQREATEKLRLLMNEVDHRAKNALAVGLAIVKLSNAEDVPSYKKLVSGRFSSLARTHSLLAQSGWVGTKLAQTVQLELAPYSGEATERVHVSGPDIVIGSSLAQPVTLVLHELATNAAKYGALAGDGGQLSVSWDRSGHDVIITWEEKTNQPVPAPDRAGFGSTLLERTAQMTPGMRLDRHFAPEGLTATITIGEAHVRDDSGDWAEAMEKKRHADQPRVLIVEDEPLVAFDIEATIRDMDLAVAGVVGTLPTAKKSLAETSCELVILDRNLHGEDTSVLALTAEERGIPVLICSGYEDPRVEGAKTDFAILRKPFNAEELRQMVQRVLTNEA